MWTVRPLKLSDDPTLDELQVAIGGYIEYVPPVGGTVEYIVNEEGRLLHFPPNQLATEMLRADRPEYQSQAELVGPVVVGRM